MERYLSNPNVDKSVVNTMQVYEGGTGGTTVKEAQENLDILDKSAVGVPNGLALMPPDGLFGSKFEGGIGETPMIDGPAYVKTNQTNRYFITNYDINTGYDFSTTLGSMTREKDILYFKSGPIAGTATIKVNDLVVNLDIFPAVVNMPFVVSPANGTKDINSKVSIRTSEFLTEEVGTKHKSTDWQISTTPEMDNIFKSIQEDSSNLTSLFLEGLSENVTYYVRVRYHDDVGNISSWSEVSTFTARKSFSPLMPEIVSPVSGAKDMKADVYFTGSAFSTYEGTSHVSSDWQLSTSSVFAGLITESEADETNLTTWSVGGLNVKTLYYVRVRYTDSLGRTSDWSLVSKFTTRDSFSAETPSIVNPSTGSKGGVSNWSDVVTFTTKTSGGGGGSVNTPSITYPSSGTNLDPGSIVITSSSFSSSSGGESHSSSDWEISNNSGFSVVVKSSYSVPGVLTSWNVTGLSGGSTYYVRVKHYGSSGGSSSWSSTVSFSTTSVNVPGANGTVTYNLPTNFVTTRLPGKDNTAIIGIMKSTIPYTDAIVQLNLNRNGTHTTDRLYAGQGIDAYDRPVGPSPGGIYKTQNSKDGSKYILKFNIYDYWGTYGYINVPSVRSNVPTVQDFLMNNDSYAMLTAGSFSADHTFNRLASFLNIEQYDTNNYYTGYKPTIRIADLLAGDSGVASYHLTATFGIPPGSEPTNFGLDMYLSGDGKSLVVLSGYNYIYLYAETGGTWGFVEKIQLPGPASNFDFSDDGTVMVVGGNTYYEAWVYTKKNGSWNNLQKIFIPGDWTPKRSYATISGDGKTLVVNGASLYSKYYVYRRMADESWGEIKIIDDPIPANGSVRDESKGLCNLSSDGTNILYFVDGYNVTSAGGSMAEFLPVLKLAY